MPRTPAVLSGLLLAACGTVPLAGPPPAPPPMDHHSFARPEQVRITHVDLDLDLLFDRKVVAGTATLKLARMDRGAPLVLDTQDLRIEEVVDGSGTALDFDLAAPDEILGSRLTIELRPGTDRVAIRYETSPGASALQWLAPEQTSGDRPFLYTQGQAILTRSWIPIQDSPAVRITYAATVRAPEGLVPVMSAEQRRQDGGAWRFAMSRPIPPYLIALACGDLARRELSSRCAVWAEPAVLGRAATELEDTERMVQACEDLFGPYRWSRYDVLILPPAFPFGGMENPCLTFATPTILAGDKSLVALIAHELAHSWSGNLVTNATWRDFWLNEGFTVYLEHRIMERVYGAERARMEIALGLRGLEEELEQLPATDQVLHVSLRGRNPDDGMTAVPYDKGAAFLRRLEEAFGRQPFDAFLEAYFDAHAFESITTHEFLDYLQEHLLAENPSRAALVDVTRWVFGPGLPEDCPRPRVQAFVRIDEHRQRFLRGGVDGALRQAAGSWTVHEWLHFLDGMPEQVSPQRLQALDSAFQLTGTGNSEILAAWLQLGIRSDYEAVQERLQEFLLRVGRRKFLKPLYKALAETPEGREIAHRIYRMARPRYHAVSVRTLDEILGLQYGSR